MNLFEMVRIKKIIILFFSIFGGLWIILQTATAFGLFEEVALKNTGIKGYLVLLAITLIFCFLSVTAFERKKTKIIVAQFGQLLPYLPLYIAKKKRFFEKVGLEVSFVNSGGDDLVWKKITNNEAQFGVGDPTILFTGKDSCKGKLIATLVPKVAIWGVTNKKIPKIKTIEEFEGYNVAVFREPSTSYKFIKYIDSINAKKSSHRPLNVVEIDPNKVYNYIKNDSVDITMVVEPIATNAEMEGYNIVFSGFNFSPKILFSGVFASENYLKENPKIVHSFIKALNQSLDFIQKDHLSTLKMAVQEFPEINPIDVELATLRLLRDGIFPLDTLVNEESWQNSFKMRFEDKDSNEYSFEEFVDNSFTINATKNNE